MNASRMQQIATRMANTIVHRGPDDAGIWTDEIGGIALAFRRLSIVDLSVLGHQPMQSAGGRFTLIFNGEIYNHRGLRNELESRGHRFRGHSDTEVALAAFEEWGIEASVKNFVGMFAIAVWDSHKHQLSLVRDRMGIKPLFVYQNRGLVSFGSELKALVAGPEFDRSLDGAAVRSYLRYLYVPAPRAIFSRAMKLLPGHILTISDPTLPLPPSRAYWSAEEVALRGTLEPFVGDDNEAVAQFESIVTEAVRLRMVADVPLGALLSGGVDSSAVVGVMQSLSSRPVKTFTIGFDQEAFNEAAHARAVAQHLGTDHTELHLTGADALAVVPRLPEMFDEPLADPSQIPTFLVCQLARQHVTVALTGDGGDELFAGYNRYISGERLISELRKYPSLLRRLTASGFAALSPGEWSRFADLLRPIFPVAGNTRLFGEKLGKVADMLRAESPSGMYRSLLSAWQRPEDLLAMDFENENPQMLNGSFAGLLERMMLADQVSYLPDDLLAKVDHASMAVSLEARVPLLDHRVVEYSWKLPRRMKVRDGRGKWILRELLYKHVPRELVDREKMGFSVPLAQWLGGPLREWAGDLLLSQTSDHLRRSAVAAEWDSFQRGKKANAAGIWALATFCAWQQRWVGETVQPATQLSMMVS